MRFRCTVLLVVLCCMCVDKVDGDDDEKERLGPHPLIRGQQRQLNFVKRRSGPTQQASTIHQVPDAPSPPPAVTQTRTNNQEGTPTPTPTTTTTTQQDTDAHDAIVHNGETFTRGRPAPRDGNGVVQVSSIMMGRTSPQRGWHGKGGKGKHSRGKKSTFGKGGAYHKPHPRPSKPVAPPAQPLTPAPQTLTPTVSPAAIVPEPTAMPSQGPSMVQSSVPTQSPLLVDTPLPSFVPSAGPSSAPVQGTTLPSGAPTTSTAPNTQPSDAPSATPIEGSLQPSVVPSIAPSNLPSIPPSMVPSAFPSTSSAPTASEPPSQSPSLSFGPTALVPDELQNCTSADECPEGACGYEIFDENSAIVCCDSNVTVTVGSDTVTQWCTGQAIGSGCGKNAMCVSDVCVQKVCQDGLQDSGEACDSNNDCINGACGHELFDASSDRICCPNNETEASSGIDYCTGQKAGDPCETDTICANQECVDGLCEGRLLAIGESCDSTAVDDCANGACGRDTFEDDSVFICCPSNETVQVGNFNPTQWCTGQQGGAPCGSPEMCQSQICLAGICTPGSAPISTDPSPPTMAPVRRTLPPATFPPIGLPDPTDQPTTQSCPPDDGSACDSGVCGLVEFTASNWICCASGETLELSDGLSYCTELEENKFCDNSNEICAGDLLCILGLCTDIRQGDGQSCTPGDDSDCTSGACGVEEFGSSDWRCCSSGTTLVLRNGLPHCTELPEGGSCDTSDQICASQSCVDGICQPAMSQVRSFPWGIENLNDIFDHHRI